MPQEKKQTVPVLGSLGLLANGAQGLRAWRDAKQKAKQAAAKPTNSHE